MKSGRTRGEASGKARAYMQQSDRCKAILRGNEVTPEAAAYQSGSLPHYRNKAGNQTRFDRALAFLYFVVSTRRVENRSVGGTRVVLGNKGG